MPLDINYSINYAKDIFSIYFGKIMRSTLWISTLITIIILFITLILYPSKNKKLFSDSVKPIIYTFLFTLIIIFIHDSFLKEDANINKRNMESDEVLENIKLYRDKESNIYKAIGGYDKDKSEDNINIRNHNKIGKEAIVNKYS